MQFMLLIIADETKPLPPPAELAKLGQAYGAFTEGIIKTGHFRAGFQLLPSTQARTVRGPLVSEGPFSAAREHLAGFYLIECENFDEATAIAARIPGVSLGEAVEVRPLVPGR
jgi:hypothetical protein